MPKERLLITVLLSMLSGVLLAVMFRLIPNPWNFIVFFILCFAPIFISEVWGQTTWTCPHCGKTLYDLPKD
jgi:hypothetical protein